MSYFMQEVIIYITTDISMQALEIFFVALFHTFVIKCLLYLLKNDGLDHLLYMNGIPCENICFLLILVHKYVPLFTDNI